MMEFELVAVEERTFDLMTLEDVCGSSAMAKVFRKCKSATFQIGSDTYTIVYSFKREGKGAMKIKRNCRSGGEYLTTLVYSTLVVFHFEPNFNQKFWASGSVNSLRSKG
ncbi:hypothetical protein OUZ56_028097 [Daphnia magna]|uniref:Uncharacterized protein n=1 Tax=Daphnia magna TaxID=35525 RepID=A0ABR0B2V3_9CRUS|nr:hypothetical protein OUZ56_028097 [Daphnia magna]